MNLLSIKNSLLCISILIISGCLPAATVITGAAGIGDSVYKFHQINDLQKRLDKLEKQMKKTKSKTTFKPYVPSYVDMHLYTKGLYDK